MATPTLKTPSLTNVNLSSLAPITTAATALSNLVLATAQIFNPGATQGYQPLNPLATNNPTIFNNPPALLFHYEGENTVELTSDITDHYIEDNTAIQDQWTLKPEKVTVHGFIGELNDVAPKGLQTIQQASQKLTTIGAYAPGLSETALLAYNEAFFAYQIGNNAVNAGVSAWSALGGTQNGENVIGSNGVGNSVSLSSGKVSNNQSKQQIAFQQFYAYWRARWLFTVQTPWAVFKNMAIESIRAVQGEDTTMITDFYVTFKLIRTAQSVTSGLPQIGQGRYVNLSSANSPNGTTTPAPSISVATNTSNQKS